MFALKYSDKCSQSLICIPVCTIRVICLFMLLFFSSVPTDVLGGKEEWCIKNVGEAFMQVIKASGITKRS